MTLLDELKAEAEQWRADGNTRIPALLDRAIAALQGQGEPVAWRVERDTEYESRKYFHTEADAMANAALGVVDSHVIPLYLSAPTIPTGWIPVSERLPEKNERVTYYFERIGVWHGVYLGGEQWRSLGGFCTGDITHWMPETLPAPPMIREAK